MNVEEFNRQFPGVLAGTTKVSSRPMRFPVTPKMTKPEAQYERLLKLEYKADEGYEIRFEKLTLVLDSGTRYTPDFTVWKSSFLVLCVEVKGSIKLKSFDRATTKFKEAITSFKSTIFRHAFISAGEWRYQQKCYNMPSFDRNA